MGSKGKESMGWLDKGAEEMGASLIKAVGVMALAEKAMELFGEAVEWTKEAIHHADFVRDLDLSLQAYTGSAEKATQVIKFFREEQVRTRNTAEELQQTFRNLNPLASAKGFSIDAQEQITVMLSQVATVANKSIDEIEAGYRRILSTGGSGGGAGRNPLLQVLGITGDQLKHMGWDEFLAKLQQASERSSEFGQTWESTMHKAEDSLKNSFAEGWNEARGSAVEGMDAITAAVADPKVKEFLHDMGVATAEWVGKLGGVITEIKGIAFEIEKVVSSPHFRMWLAMATLGGSEAARLLIGGASMVGEAGNQQLARTAAASRATVGADILSRAGLAAPRSPNVPADSSSLAETGLFGFGGNALAQPPSASGDANAQYAKLRDFLGAQVATNQLTSEQIAATTAQLKLNIDEARSAGRAVNADDITAAIAEGKGTGTIDGAPHGKLKSGNEKDIAADIKAQTDQLIAQTEVLDLQKKKLGEQAELDQIALQLGEKKTGLESVVLDSITQQLLARQAIVRQQVVETNQQDESVKAKASYDQESARIAKERLKDGADQKGLDGELAAAQVRYAAALGVAGAMTAKARTDALVADKKDLDAAQQIAQARADALVKLQQTVSAQNDQNDIIASQLAGSKQQAEFAAIELALSNQKAVFGGVVLSQEAASLLHQHETLALAQAANETEIKMQEERKRYSREQADLDKQIQDAVASNDPNMEVTLANLNALADAQKIGNAQKLNAIQAEGANAMMTAHERERAYTNQTLDILMKGYAELASLMETAVNDAFTGLISGHGMKSALQNLADGFRKTMSSELTGIVTPFLSKLQSMAQGKAQWDPNARSADGEGVGAFVQPSQPQQRNAQIVSAGIQGAAALYSIYQQGQAGVGKEANAISGVVSGAAAGAIAGPWGLVIGGLVGGVVGFLSGKNKAKFTVSVTGGKVAITGSGEATMADVNASLSAINAQIASASASVWQIFDAFPLAIAQSLQHFNISDVFKDGVVGATTPFTSQTFFGKLFDFDPLLKKLRATVHGLQGGLTGDDLKNFIQNEVPKMYLDAFTPVIQGGLSALGVADAKIKSLFDASATQDPTAFFKFIADYITGFVAMKDTIDFLGKTSAQKTGVAAGMSLDDQFAKANAQIAYMGKGFADLTNEDQVARLGQINAAIAQRYQLELQYLNDIANARKAINTSYADTRTAFAMSAASPQQQLIMLQNQRDAVAASLNDQVNQRSRQVIAGAKTPAEVVAIANSYQQLTQSIYNAAKSLRDSFQSILDSFDALDKQKIADKLAALDPSDQLRAITGKATGIASAYGGMSQADQLTHGQELLQLATQYYNVQKQALLDLGSAAKNIHDSIAKQIFGIKFDQFNELKDAQGNVIRKADPQAQLEMLMAQQRALYASISSATTAQQINDIVSQISGNQNTILGLEGNTPEAAAASINALQEADKAAQLQIAVLTAQATANDAAVQAAVKAVGDQVTITVTTLNTLMTNATNDLIAFNVLIQQKLDKFVDAMAASDASLLLTLQPIFTALGTAATTTGSALGDASDDLHKFSGALDGATDALNRFGRGGTAMAPVMSGPPNSSNMNVQFAPRLDINVSGDMAPFVSMIRAVFVEEMDNRQTQQARFARGGASL